MTTKELTIIMPVHNEAEVIEKVVVDFHNKIIKKMPGSELIVTEDGSTDGTRDVLKNLAKKIKFTLIATPEKKGYFRAAKEAMALAKGRYVLFTDSDNTHDPGDFWKMYNAIKDCDIVLGFRKSRQDSLFRKLVTRLHNTMINALFLVNFPDINCPFRLIKKEVIQSVLPHVRFLRYAISTEFIIRASKSGYRIKVMEVKHLPRKTGKTFINTRKLPGIVWRYATDMIKLRLYL